MARELTYNESIMGLSDSMSTLDKLVGEMTLAQVRVFLLVAQNNSYGIPGSQVADALQISKGNASRTLAILGSEQLTNRQNKCHGLIKMENRGPDARMRFAFLTEKGLELSVRLAGCFLTQGERARQQAEWDLEILPVAVEPQKRQRKDRDEDPETDYALLERYWAKNVAKRRLSIIMNPEDPLDLASDMVAIREWLPKFAATGDAQAKQMFQDAKKAVVQKVYPDVQDKDVDPILAANQISPDEEEHLEDVRHEQREVNALTRRARRVLMAKNLDMLLNPKRK